MQDTLWLLPGGKGHLQTRSVLQGVENYPLRWRHVEPGVLLFDRIFPYDSPDEEPDWLTITYCADRIKIDSGGATVHALRSASDILTWTHFWDLVGPIEFVSPIDEQTLPSFVLDLIAFLNKREALYP